MKNSTPAETTEFEDFKKVCSIDSLKEYKGKRFFIDDIEVAVFKIDGEVHALSNICPHQHTALIYDGFIEDGCVVCPAHGWMFNLKTGRMPADSKGLDSYPAKVIDGNVFIKVIKKELNW
ncbi:MAG: Rieske 2Fe-2S domain-containing protein [Ignavibacteriaceae bacterium]|jgi:nitrite reductase/ring-hydroxylating ferredoxin subunit